MIDTNKYKGHAQGEWTTEMNDTYDECSINAQDYGTIAQVFYRDYDKLFMATSRLIADAPKLLAEVKRLRDELDRQMEYIEWLEEFAPKAGEYNTSWDAYELAKGIHWTQMEDEEE